MTDTDREAELAAELAALLFPRSVQRRAELREMFTPKSRTYYPRFPEGSTGRVYYPR